MQRRKKQSKDVIRDGDLIKIIEPKLFVRCGYPLSKNMAREKARHILSQVDDSCLELMGFTTQTRLNILKIKPVKKNSVNSKLVDLIASNIMIKEKYGGRDRSIHTIEIPELKDKTFYVIGKKMVKTGIYHAGYSGYTYDGDWDGCSPYLENMQGHLILEIESYSSYYEDSFTGPSRFHSVKKTELSELVERHLKEDGMDGFAEEDLEFFKSKGFYRIEASNCVKVFDKEDGIRGRGFVKMHSCKCS